MKILIVSSEAVPYVQTGGLGDVVGTLAKHFSTNGHQVQLVIPFYKSIKQSKFQPELKSTLPSLTVEMGDETLQCRVWESTCSSNLRVFFIEYNQFYYRDSLYDDNGLEYQDNGERFAFLCKAALDLSIATRFKPDIVHANDWQTSLIPYYLKTWYWKEELLRDAASVLTIHNMGYQGTIPRSKSTFIGLNWMQMRADEFEDRDEINLLKGGIFYADTITTVSPTYAKEILSEPGGCGLSPYLGRRTDDVAGILNGVDSQTWNPEIDRSLPKNYWREDLTGKAICKAELQKRFRLPANPRIPIFAIVSRLAYQKGFQILIDCIDTVMQWELQLVLLGSGDAAYSDFFNYLASKYPSKVGVYIGFQSDLSHIIEAGSDFFIMPSLYEPCGLNQMYSMLYGTLPIVRATGGLNDTVVNFDEKTMTGTGFVFEDITSEALKNTIGWALSTWYDNPEAYRRLQSQAMDQDFSWERLIPKYEAVFEQAINRRKSWH